MQICINGKLKQIKDPSTIAEFLVSLGVGEHVVVELNGRIVKAEQFSEIRLKESDQIEVVQFVGGGSVG